jgi:flap endonuclease-1
VGVPLRDLLHPREVALSDLTGRKLALDAYNMIYQFLATIRQVDGHPFTDRQGGVTSHLVGLLHRTTSLLRHGVLPAYVFDGPPSELKAATLHARALAKARAQEQWEEALAAGDLEAARKRAGATSRLTPEMAEDARELLRRLGVPCVQAPSEGEAQAAHMARQGQVWAAASEDYDTLLFGAPRLVRGLGAIRSGRSEREGTVQVLEVSEILQELGIDQRELIVLGMLVGTDFNEGVYGIGPKKAWKLVQQHWGPEATFEKVGVPPSTWRPVLELFENPPVTDRYELVWRRPDPEGVRKFLVEDRGFDPDRVNRALRGLPSEAPRSASGTQTTLLAYAEEGTDP